MFTRLLASMFRKTPLAVLRKVTQAMKAGLRSSLKHLSSFAISLVPVAACQSGINPKPVPQPGLVSELDESIIESLAPKGPRSIGHFKMSFYYVIGEDEVRSKPITIAANTAPSPANPELAAEFGAPQPNPETAIIDDSVHLAATVATAPERVTLYAGGTDCHPIANVSTAFAAAAEMQGTGKLRDGRTVNIWGACNCEHSPCFRVTGSVWGTGARRALAPFRTVAVDRKLLPLGQLLYIPALEGRTMPGRPPWGGFVHDGCVVAEDTGGAISGKRLDFFVGRKAYYQALSARGGSHNWAQNLEVFDGTKECENKDGKVSRTAPNTL
jgi:3D (Asp-Asp-Asp) domain-containing protein